jgi:peptide deformylase
MPTEWGPPSAIRLCWQPLAGGHRWLGGRLESTLLWSPELAVCPVLRLGDPRLRQPSLPVPEDWFGGDLLEELLTDLRDTMAARQGAGLAAPQIARPWRVVIYGINGNPRYPEAPPIPETVLINPNLTPVGTASQLGWEGCLSVPGLRGQVARWQTLQLAWRDPLGQAHGIQVDGFHARVVQHECDHLDGMLFTDRLVDPAAFGFEEELVAAGRL